MASQRRTGVWVTGTQRYVLALLSAVPLVLAGAGPFDEPRPIRNVLIVTLDTTRAD